jgi:hypothetical protein
VVVVEDRFEIEQQRRMTLDAQSRRGEEGAVHALHGALAKDAPRRTATRAGHVVIEAVQELLDAPRRRQPRQEPRFPPRQPEIGRRVLPVLPGPAHAGIMRSRRTASA